MSSPAYAALLLGGIMSSCMAQLTQDVVSTTTGQVQGIELPTRTGRVRAFLGIPYAEPPTGELRFQKPVSKRQWEGVLNATSLPPLCSQLPARVNMFLHIKATDKTSENCLYLNVFTPVANDSLKPVVVYIHGGGFSSGGISLEATDSSELSVRGDLVAVAIAYRLGAFGFLSLASEDAPGNMGLYDQVTALRWVKGNIQVFGGDPDKVTLMGPSAGSLAVGVHILSPLSRGLFQRAIMQSGSPFSVALWNTRDQASLLSSKLSIALGCEASEKSQRENETELLECLRSKDVASILMATKHISGGGFEAFFPVFGDELVPEQPEEALRNGNINAVDLLAGITEAEGDFLLYLLFHPIRNLSRADGVTKGEVMFLLKMLLTSTVPVDANVVLDHYFADVEQNDSVKALHAGADIFGHLQIVCPTLEFTKRLEVQNNSVYTYQFSHKPSFSDHPDWIRTTHGDDIPFSLGSMFKLVDEPSQADVKAADNLLQAISSFSRTGIPTITGQVPWPRYNEERSYGDIATNSFTPKRDLKKSECAFWNEILRVN
ncbi:unnamed protein product [Ixodes hexagonus]